MRRLASLAGRALDFFFPGAFFIRRRRMIIGVPMLVLALAFYSALITYYSSAHQALSPLGLWYQFDPRSCFMGQALETGEDLIALNVQPRSHSITKVSPIWPDDARTIYTRMNGAARIYHLGSALLLLVNVLVVSAYGRKR